ASSPTPGRPIIPTSLAVAKHGKNERLHPIKSDDSDDQFAQAVGQFADLQPEIWQYGSDDVVQAFAVWYQIMRELGDGQQDPAVALVLMADVIVKMRQDMGLSKKKGIPPLDILRIFITDIEDTYNEHAAAAREFKKSLLKKKHIAV
ncbi:MAG: hypothetical protein JXB30_02640, partial [Anaerolineae bacterium]|nr:hypothetical protein [Anaerolineae bacterium]